MLTGRVQVEALGKHIIEEGRMRPGQVLWLDAQRAKSLIDAKVVKLVGIDEKELDVAAELDRAYDGAAKQITGKEGAMELDYVMNGIANHFQVDKDIVRAALLKRGAVEKLAPVPPDAMEEGRAAARKQQEEDRKDAAAKRQATQEDPAGPKGDEQSSSASPASQSTDSAPSSEAGKDSQSSASQEALASTVKASPGLFGRGKRAASK